MTDANQTLTEQNERLVDELDVSTKKFKKLEVTFEKTKKELTDIKNEINTKKK